jgi:hypothetical protein
MKPPVDKATLDSKGAYDSLLLGIMVEEDLSKFVALLYLRTGVTPILSETARCAFHKTRLALYEEGGPITTSMVKESETWLSSRGYSYDITVELN